MRTNEWVSKKNAKRLCFVVLFLVLGLSVVSAGPIGDVNRRSVFQVALADYPKVSQYADIDSSDHGYGLNACGLVAAASALGGPNWTRLVDEIAVAAGTDYSKYSGIQPNNYESALKKVFGDENVSAMNNASLDNLFAKLQAGKIVIVDIKVNPTLEFPSADPPTYAHFARVIGIDKVKQEIYLQNTLDGAPYWTVSFSDFSAAWDTPETTSSLIADRYHADPVTNWLVAITPQPLLGDKNPL